MSAIIVGTDGTPALDRRVREAAHAAQVLRVPLHVVCSVPPLSSSEQRSIDRALPADLAHLAGREGQRRAAVQEVRSLVGRYCDELHVTATDQRLKSAVRELARTVNGEPYGTRERRLRMPALGLRARVTA